MKVMGHAFADHPTRAAARIIFQKSLPVKPFGFTGQAHLLVYPI
jgi:hypothetical protein